MIILQPSTISSSEIIRGGDILTAVSVIKSKIKLVFYLEPHQLIFLHILLHPSSMANINPIIFISLIFECIKFF